MSRSVKEWIGKTDDTPVPPRVKLRILRDQNDRCAGMVGADRRCPVIFDARNKPEFDHVVALVNGGRNREENLRALCKNCHRDKTDADVDEKSKVNAIKAKHLGLKAPKRPFPKRADPWGRDYLARKAAQS